MAKDLQVRIIGDASSYQRALQKSQGMTSKFGAVAKGALIGGAAAGVYALGKAAKIGWDEYNQGAKVAAQTNAVIKSTGGAANVTAKHVEDLGKSLMNLSGVDDETIKSGENILLTFKGIRNEAGKNNDIFDQTTKASLDMATALGMDTPSAAMALGKALNAPADGLSKLTRMGVTFTDKQKEMITTLSENGKTMQAQKIILGELRSEFGGSAKAAGQTLGGQINILHERFNNFLGDLVAKAIPYLQRFAKWVIPEVTKASKELTDFWNTQLGPTVRSVIATGRRLWDKYGEDITRIFHDIVRNIRNALKVVLAVVRLFAAILRGDWREAWNALKDIVVNVLHLITGVLRGWKDIVLAIAKGIGGALKDGIVAGARGLAGIVSSLARGAINAVIRAFNNLLSFTVHVPSILPGPSSYTVDFPDIPEVATGGYVNRSGLAVIHRGETVVPAFGGMSPRGGNVQVIVLGGDRGAIEWLRSLDARSGRRSGRGVL